MFCFMTKHTLLGLGCVFLPWTHASGRFGTFCVPKCCTIRNLPRKSESCNKIRRFLPWPSSLGRFLRHGVRCKFGVWTVRREAQWRAQGLPIAIVEEIAFENGWITRDQLMESADRYGKSPYGQHLKGIADGEIMLVPNQKN